MGRLGFTYQLQDFYEYAKSSGRTFDLVVRANTRLVGRLAELERDGKINVRRILPAG